MENLKSITLEKARKMSVHELRLEIGKRANYLINELGMNKVESYLFVSSLLNLGASMQEEFDSKKEKKD